MQSLSGWSKVSVVIVSLILLNLMILICEEAKADGFMIIPPPPPERPRPPKAPDPLSIDYHRVNVTIKDQVALVAIDQVFRNHNPFDVEGMYIFPIPESAAISKFSLYIEDREVIGEVLDKEKARAIYEDIVRRMRDPALLEYIGKDLFKARVYPIPAKGTRRIKLNYTQTLTQELGLVQFVYPLNTERFSYLPINDVSVDLTILSREPIKTIYSPSHAIDIVRKGDYEARISYEEHQTRPDCDLVLYYTISKDSVGMNLLTFKERGRDGYFLLMIAPEYAHSAQDAIPKTVIFAFDTSGSMQGDKLKQAKAALRYCVGSLNDADRFALIRFSTEAQLLEDGVLPATDQNKEKAFQAIEKFKATGGTNIQDALRLIAELAPDEQDRPVIVLFMTDGLPTIGDTDEQKLTQQVSHKLDNTRFFCFGVGYDVNTHLLDLLAQTYRGRSDYVKPEEDIEVKVSNLFEQISMPVLTNLKLAGLNAIAAYDLMPRVLPDLFHGSQLTLVGRYTKSGSIALTLQGTARETATSHVIEGTFPDRDLTSDFIPFIWASRRVGFLMDEIRLHGENRELVEEIIRLSKEFGIITPYTSFLVTEDTASASRARPITDQQAGTVSSGGNGTEGYNVADVFKPQASSPDADFAASTIHEKSGRSAVSLSKTANELKSSIAPAKSKTIDEQVAQTAVKRIADRTFYLSKEMWIDSRYRTSMKLVTITFNSDRYFKLITDQPELARFLGLGRNLIVVLGEVAYQIVESTAEP